MAGGWEEGHSADTRHLLKSSCLVVAVRSLLLLLFACRRTSFNDDAVYLGPTKEEQLEILCCLSWLSVPWCICI